MSLPVCLSCNIETTLGIVYLFGVNTPCVKHLLMILDHAALNCSLRLLLRVCFKQLLAHGVELKLNSSAENFISSFILLQYTAYPTKEWTCFKRFFDLQKYIRMINQNIPCRTLRVMNNILSLLCFSAATCACSQVQ